MSSKDSNWKTILIDILCLGGFLLFFISLPLNALEFLEPQRGMIVFSNPTSTGELLMWLAFFLPIITPFWDFPEGLFIMPLFMPFLVACYFTMTSPLQSLIQHLEGKNRNKQSGIFLVLMSIVIIFAITLIPLFWTDVGCLAGYYVWVAAVLASWSGIVLATLETKPPLAHVVNGS